MHRTKRLLTGLVILGSFSLAWSQPGAEGIQTKTAKEVKDQKTKKIDLDGQFVRGELIFDPNIWVMPIEVEKLAIDLDRDFSEYLVANLDRESVEHGNQEN